MSNHPIKILVVEPAKAPYVKEIDGSLESMQALVGGGIEAAYPYDEPVALRGAVSEYLDVFRDRAIQLDRNHPKLIYIHLCAPAGEVEKNIAFAREKAREVFAEGNVPICPHYDVSSLVIAKSACRSFRLQRKLRPLPCASSSSRTHFAGLRLES